MTPVPDIVAEAAPGIANSEPQPDANGHLWYFTDDVKKAILNGDTAALQKAKKEHTTELRANYDAIKKNSTDAFTTVTNPSNGQEYQLCASDSGWLWFYTTKVEHVDAKARATVCVGSFSKNTKFMGISTHTMHNLAFDGVATIASMIAMRYIATFINRRLTGVIVRAALRAAEAAALEGLEAGGFMIRSAAVKVIGGLGGLIGGAAIAILVLFLFDVIIKAYGLEVNIYNWSDKEQWDVVECHPDNMVIHDEKDEEEPFKEAHLLPVSKAVVLPDGFSVPSKDALATYATYVFQNDSKFLEGVGVGLKLVSKNDSSRVIYLKYVVRRLGDNKLGLGNASHESLTAFYEGEWATVGAMTVKLTLPSTAKAESVSIIGLTPALNNGDGNLFSYDVHIGVTN